MTRIEFQEIVQLVCPYCRKGIESRQRHDNGEFVHDMTRQGVISHTICWATGLKNSKYAEEAK
jgi:hypothetical protein